MVRNPASSGISASHPPNPGPCDFSAPAAFIHKATFIHLFPSIKHVSCCGPGLLVTSGYFHAMVGIPALSKFSVKRLMAFENPQCDEYLSVVFTAWGEGTNKGHPTW